MRRRVFQHYDILSLSCVLLIREFEGAFPLYIYCTNNHTLLSIRVPTTRSSAKDGLLFFGGEQVLNSALLAVVVKSAFSRLVSHLGEGMSQTVTWYAVS